MKIQYVEVYLPEKIITNQDLESEFPNWSSEKIESKIGISQRHIAEEKETAVDLGEKAALKLLNKYDKDQVDFLLFCTQSPDHFLPTSACILQERLELRTDIGAIDYNLGCSGYVYGLALAKGLLASNIAKCILLITAETYSKHINKKDIANRAIFGDGATATIISKETIDENDNLGEFVLGTDGKGQNNLIVKNGAFRSTYSEDAEELTYGNGNIYTDNDLFMNGPEIFNFTIEKIPHLVNQVLERNKLCLEDIDYFIFHQANKYMLNYLRRKAKIPKEKFHINMSDSGNTVSNSIPIALQDCINNKNVSTGSKVMLVGFGVGYSWGATIITL